MLDNLSDKEKGKLFGLLIINIIILVIYICGMCFGLYPAANVNDINLHWFIFGFLIIFFTLTLNLIRKYSIYSNLTENKDKIINRIFFRLVFNIVIWCLFYMGIFIKSVPCINIFGILSMILAMIQLVKNFIGVDKTFKKLLPLDLIVILGITIFLIYLIPKYNYLPKEDLYNLQKIVIAIIAAIYGGLITLTGVAWTIKNNHEIRKQDEKQRNKPIFEFNVIFNYSSVDEKYISLNKYFKNNEGALFFQFRNSDNSNFIIKEICINDNIHQLSRDNYIFKNDCKYYLYWLDIDKRLLVNKDNYMTIEDVMGNKYYYKFKYCKSDRNKFYIDIKEIVLSDYEYLKLQCSIYNKKSQEKK